MRWMEIAWAELGVHETAGAEATPAIVEYFRDAGRPEVTSDEIPWCAAFAGACLSRSGIALAALPKDERLLARSYLKIGTPLEAPRVGALAILRRTADPAHGHVGFVARWTDTTITLLGGNQADSVSEATFPRAMLLGLRWPETVTPAELDAAGSRITVAAGKQQADGVKGGGVVTGGEAVPAPAPLGEQRIPGLKELGENAGQLRGTIETLEQFVVFAWSKLPLVAVAIALYFVARMVWRSGWIRSWRAEDASSGAHTGRAVTATGGGDGVV